MSTAAPSTARRRAAASPIPRAAPVTIATFSFKFIMSPDDGCNIAKVSPIAADQNGLIRTNQRTMTAPGARVIVREPSKSRQRKPLSYKWRAPKNLKIEFVDIVLVKDKRGAKHDFVPTHFDVAEPARAKRGCARLQVAIDQRLARINGQVTQIHGIPQNHAVDDSVMYIR